MAVSLEVLMRRVVVVMMVVGTWPQVGCHSEPWCGSVVGPRTNKDAQNRTDAMEGYSKGGGVRFTDGPRRVD